MKKSLFALAAVGAFTGAAQAQSSVTVYGILDAGYIGSSRAIVTGATAGTTTKTTTSAFGQSAETTSRLGFRGTEDLGGGMRSFFTVELGLTPQNGNLSGSSNAKDTYQNTMNNGGTAVDNRQSFVGVGKKGIGQFALGRQYTPVFNAGAATSPGQYNNIVGDVFYAGGASGMGSDAAGYAGGSGSSLAFTNRASNALTVQTDRFAGLQLSGMYAMLNQDVSNTGTAGGNKNWNGWGLGADFRWQKLIVTAAYQSFKTLNTYAVSSSALDTNFGAGVTSSQQMSTTSCTTNATCTTTNLSPASNRSDKQSMVGAVYDFGILKAYAQWVGRKIQEDTASTGITAGEQLNRTAQQIGVRGNITPTIEYWGSIGNGRMKATAGAATLNFTGYQLGSNYYLSKRTNMYAIYGQSQTSSSSMITGAGSRASQYALGVRHTF